MSSKSASDRDKRSPNNSQVKSSLVHKPFATGTINIFNPHRSKKNSNKLSPPKLFSNAELEQDLDKRKAELELSELNVEPDEIEYRQTSWWDSLLSPYGISAIAILVSVNLISAGFIWRNLRNADNSPEVEPLAKVGNNHLGDREFMPLNLSTLGAIETIKQEEVEPTPKPTPIAPALAPLEDIASLSSLNTEYHYILAEYTGEESLSTARKKVKQISLVNFPQGIFVYMGAFKNKEDADLFVRQLKQEDFPAHVYPLD